MQNIPAVLETNRLFSGCRFWPKRYVLLHSFFALPAASGILRSDYIVPWRPMAVIPILLQYQSRVLSSPVASPSTTPADGRKITLYLDIRFMKAALSINFYHYLPCPGRQDSLMIQKANPKSFVRKHSRIPWVSSQHHLYNIACT